MDIITVPDIDGPTEQLCWKQSPLMIRCDRRKDHQGLHSWEYIEIERAIEEIRVVCAGADEWRGSMERTVRLHALIPIAQRLGRSSR